MYEVERLAGKLQGAIRNGIVINAHGERVFAVRSSATGTFLICYIADEKGDLQYREDGNADMVGIWPNDPAWQAMEAQVDDAIAEAIGATLSTEPEQPQLFSLEAPRMKPEIIEVTELPALGFEPDEIVSLIWLQQAYFAGTPSLNDRGSVVAGLQFIKGLVVQGKMEP